MQGNNERDSISETRRYQSMITRYDPFREALSLRRAMDQLFEQSFVNPSMMSGSPTMLAPMDVCETDNGYEVDVALPGVRPEDIELTVDQNTLTIRGRFSHQNDPLDWTSGTQSWGRRGNGAVLRARGLAGGTAAPCLGLSPVLGAGGHASPLYQTRTKAGLLTQRDYRAPAAAR